MNKRLDILSDCVLNTFIGEYFCYNKTVEEDNLIKLYFDNDNMTYDLFVEVIGRVYYISKGDLTIHVSDISKVIYVIHSALKILENSYEFFGDGIETKAVFNTSIKRLDNE